MQFSAFSLTCFDRLSWNFAYDFVLMYYRSSSSVVTLHPSGSPSIHLFSVLAFYMHWQLSWNFKFDFGFFYAFLLEIKVSYNNTLLKCSWRSYYAPFAVLMYNLNLEYWKYTVFLTFLLHALTYLAEILNDFVLLYYRWRLSDVNLCQFL